MNKLLALHSFLLGFMPDIAYQVLVRILSVVTNIVKKD